MRQNKCINEGKEFVSMKRCVRILLVIFALAAIIVGSLAIGSNDRRAEAMFGGAVLIMNETVRCDAA